jgi:hypothetical protein
VPHDVLRVLVHADLLCAGCAPLNRYAQGEAMTRGEQRAALLGLLFGAAVCIAALCYLLYEVMPR